MDNPLYMPKGWRAGSVRLQPTVAHQESGGTYVKGKGVFSPVSLFLGSEPGLVFDMSNSGSRFQDSARTVPVAASGDQFGGILDLSGRGNNAGQATAGSCPKYDLAAGLSSALFDGADDSWQTFANLDLSATDKVTVIAGVRKLSDAADGMVYQLAASSGNFDLRAPGSATATKFQYASRGATTTVVPFTSSAAYNAPISAVVSTSSDIAAPNALMRVNGVQVAAVGTTQGGGNFSNAVLNIGRAGGTSLPFNGQLYSLIIIGRLLTAPELANAERWTAQRCGVTLP